MMIKFCVYVTEREIEFFAILQRTNRPTLILHSFFFRKASAGLAYREGWVIFDRYRSAEGKELPLTKPPLFLVLIGKIERSPDEIIEAAKLSRMKKVAISSSNIF